MFCQATFRLLVFLTLGLWVFRSGLSCDWFHRRLLASGKAWHDVMEVCKAREFSV